MLSPRMMAVYERRNQALRLRADGLTYGQIAERMQYVSESAAYRDIQKALVASTREVAAEIRQIELARLDMLWTKSMEILCRRHVVVSQGRVVVRDGQDVVDDMPALAAIDRLVKIQERRSKLLGLDAPLKHEVVTIDMVEAEIAKLTAELAATGAGAADLDRAEIGALEAAPEAAGGDRAAQE